LRPNSMIGSFRDNSQRGSAAIANYKDQQALSNSH
jgi:hypothetical protein